MQKFNSFDIYTQNTTLDERQQFANLLTDCCFKSKLGKTYTTKRRSQDAARENLIEMLIEEGILDESLRGQKFGKNGKVQCNHLCSNHGGKDGPVCCNPRHLYMGSQKENWEDVDPETGLSAKESATIAKNTEESKEKASLSQKISWAERKAKLLQTDKE